MKKALLFGASGFVGSYLLRDLLAEPGYERVTAVARRPLDIEHPKLQVLIGDDSTLASLKENLAADDVFISLGTTTKKTPDQAAYYRIDHDYPVLAAAMAREEGARSVFLVSAVGANVNSAFFYVRTKGETERDIIALGYDHTHIFRPSVIMGNRQEYRAMESLLIKTMAVLNPLFAGPFSRYRGMEASAIARAMCKAASRPAGKVTLYEWKDMNALLDA